MRVYIHLCRRVVRYLVPTGLAPGPCGPSEPDSLSLRTELEASWYLIRSAMPVAVTPRWDNAVKDTAVGKSSLMVAVVRQRCSPYFYDDARSRVAGI